MNQLITHIHFAISERVTSYESFLKGYLQFAFPWLYLLNLSSMAIRVQKFNPLYHFNILIQASAYTNKICIHVYLRKSMN